MEWKRRYAPVMSGLGLLLSSILVSSPATPVARSGAVSQRPSPAPSRDARTVGPSRTRFAWPVQGPVTSGFGARRFWGRHRGVDIKAPSGTPIRAAAPGTVEFSGRQSSYGRVIILAHANGFRTVYAHNTKNLVRTGDRVAAGSEIGTVGHSGRATANHVHFEVRRRGVAQDPLAFLEPRSSDRMMLASRRGGAPDAVPRAAPSSPGIQQHKPMPTTTRDHHAAASPESNRRVASVDQGRH